MASFKDGLESLTNSLLNRRKASSTNSMTKTRVHDNELRAAFITGISSKIIRIKTGYALKDTLQFKNDDDKKFYNYKLSKLVQDAAKYQLGFGRGIIVIAEIGTSLSDPLKGVPTNYKLKAFSGDMVSSGEISTDLLNDRYYKPIYYTVRGKRIHHSRVIDFTYVMPVEDDLPTYKYGGISETELIYDQLINAGIIERATSSIVEKSSTMIYKIKGFKQLMSNKKEDDVLRYLGALEDLRSMYGAGVLDSEDTLEQVNQTLQNLSESNDIGLRYLALVTGIPVSVLVGENVKGLNSSGEQERTTFQDTIEAYQSDYLKSPISELMIKLGRNEVQFKDNQGATAQDRIEYETKAIDNALKLAQIGEDYESYLKSKDVVKNDIEDFFKVKQ